MGGICMPLAKTLSLGFTSHKVADAFGPKIA